MKDMPEGFFELKLCKGKSIRWDAVREHQIMALQAVAGSGFYHKIQDTPVSATSENSKFRFTKRKPFDCFFVKCFPAYVVICWYEIRKRKTLYFIPIDRYVDDMAAATKKSFTEHDASLMAKFVIEL